jgi:hypothetical protein
MIKYDTIDVWDALSQSLLRACDTKEKQRKNTQREKQTQKLRAFFPDLACHLLSDCSRVITPYSQGGGISSGRISQRDSERKKGEKTKSTAK